LVRPLGREAFGAPHEVLNADYRVLFAIAVDGRRLSHGSFQKDRRVVLPLAPVDDPVDVIAPEHARPKSIQFSFYDLKLRSQSLAGSYRLRLKHTLRALVPP
jgi:hypothetical protein